MKKLLALICLLLIFISCNHSPYHKEDTKSESQDMVIDQTLQAPSDNKDLQQKRKASDTSLALQQIPPDVSSAHIDWDKKIIKTANIKIEVKDFKTFTDVVHKAAKQYGGYIANEQQTESDAKIESTISIKVPVDQFESLLNQLPSNDSKVIEINIVTDDVTGEVVDTKSRLQAKEQMRLKYLEFLKQAKNMEDVLKVQNEINSIQEQMESASGRVNYLSHQSAFSTIILTFYQPLPGFVPTDKTPTFSYRIIDSFKTGLNFITEIFIGLISIWPLLLILIIGWIVYKKRHVSIIASKQKL